MTESIFKKTGLSSVINSVKEEIRELYASDPVPWIIGYSGGKDSTACVQLIWSAISELPVESRHKVIHVISTDTMVENPIVSSWVNRSLAQIRIHAQKMQMPFESHQLQPEVIDTFWVQLVGKGYPAPRHMFRWCTERLKIKPSNKFISQIIQEHGQAILVLGTRKSESSVRASVMARYAKNQIRSRLSPSGTLQGSLIYTPIEDWTNDDVWMYLTQIANPWDFSNEQLLSMYAGATEGGECPLVVDTSTPSCGDSRFGCWVCTLVDKDKSMNAMISNDGEKEWMSPLMDIRHDLLDIMRDEPGVKGSGPLKERKVRDFRRSNGNVQLFEQGKENTGRKFSQDDEMALIHGPYIQSHREKILLRLLQAQTEIRKRGHQAGKNEIANFEVISMDELKEIRKIWVNDKHEIEDSLPTLYEQATGTPYPDPKPILDLPFGQEALSLLRETCEALSHKSNRDEDSEIRYSLIRELISVETRYRHKKRRSGLLDSIEKAVNRNGYWSKKDAIEIARARKNIIDDAAEIQDSDGPSQES